MGIAFWWFFSVTSCANKNPQWALFAFQLQWKSGTFLTSYYILFSTFYIHLKHYISMIYKTVQWYGQIIDWLIDWLIETLFIAVLTHLCIDSYFKHSTEINYCLIEYWLMLFGDVCAGVLTHCTIYKLIGTFCCYIGVVARHITKIVFFKRKIIVKFTEFCLVNIIINIFYFGMKKRWPTAKEDLKQRRERSADFMI